jgi:hypothetical protein
LDAGAFEAEAGADAGMDVFVCLAQGTVGCAAGEGLHGGVVAWFAGLSWQLDSFANVAVFTICDVEMR